MSLNYNQAAWDEIAGKGDLYYHVASADEIKQARSGTIDVKLTPTKRVPSEWIGDVTGMSVLCLACGGGQQGPLFAAAGARVSVFDLSEKQLARDREVAERFELELTTVQGDMADLSGFHTECIDLIVNPCSVCFVEDVLPVWNEAFRVLKNGGSLLSGFINPVNYIFDPFELERDDFRIRHRIPYRDVQLSALERDKLLGTERPVEYGHSLQQLIGGQLEAGFALTGFYEDRWGDSDKLSDYIPVFAATCATKLSAKSQ